MPNTHTEVPTTPQLALPNNGHLQPTPDVTVLGLMLSLATVKASPFIIRELRLLIQALKENPQSPDKE